MRTIIKILSLFLSCALMTALATDGDHSHDSINKRLLDESEREPMAHKRQRTQAYGSIANEIIAELDKVEKQGEKFIEKYKGSEKYKEIDNFESYLESLKRLAREFRSLAVGEDAENRWVIMGAALEQLKERYYCNFFAKPPFPAAQLQERENYNGSFFDNPSFPGYGRRVYLPEELKHLIFSYCPMEDIARLLFVSRDAREDVYSLVPVFKRVVRYGKYQDINEFLDEFHNRSPRAYAAAGIAQYHSPKRELHRRNKWLDFAYKACDLSAISFVFQSGLFMDPQVHHNVNKNLAIIKQAYKKQGVGEDLSLDKGVAGYLDNLLSRPKSMKEVKSIINILTASLPRSIEANLTLYKAYLTGVTADQKKMAIAFPKDIDKANEHYRKANEIANALPSFERSMAHYEIGLWQLAKNSISTTRGMLPETDHDLINQQWEQAIDAWTEAEGGNRQKAVAHFKRSIMESFLFPRSPCSLNYPSSNPTFLSTTEHLSVPGGFRGKEKIIFKFLKKLYEKDKKEDDQLPPYHHDIEMLLLAAKNIKKYYLSYAPYLGTSKSQPPGLAEASDYFRKAINLRLKDYDEGIRDKFTNEFNAILQGRLTNNEIFEAYERILEQLGLGDPSLTPGSAE